MNVADISSTINCHRGTLALSACDVNCDGDVTTLDVFIVECHFVGRTDCCSAPFGACCDFSTAFPCVETVGARSCDEIRSGTYLGDGTRCGIGPCDCNDNGIDDLCDTTCDGACLGVSDCGGYEDCDDDGTPDECEDPAPDTLGGCCFETGGVPSCAKETDADCLSVGGTWRGPCTECPQQNADLVDEPGGEIFVHVIGPPVDCEDVTDTSKRLTTRAGGPFIDAWHSPVDGTMCHTFGVTGSPAIPAGSFGTGSDSFAGTVCLEGVDLGHPDFPGADTLIERPAAPIDVCAVPSGTPETVPIQIVPLSLRSVSPITVTYNGGQSLEAWGVAVDLSDVAAPAGSLTAVMSHCNGGLYTSAVPVQPRFRFTRDSNQAMRTLDTGLAGHDPIVRPQTDPAPWVRHVDEELPVPAIDAASSFHAAIDDVYKALPLVCDCNGNSIHDRCELEDGSLADCNASQVPDECEIDRGLVLDFNQDGVPDGCTNSAIPRKNRAASFAGPTTTTTTASVGNMAVRVRLTRIYDESRCPPRGSALDDLSVLESEIRRLGPPEEFPDEASPPMPNFIAARLQCSPYFRDWSQPALAAEFIGNAASRAGSCSHNGARICHVDADCRPGGMCEPNCNQNATCRDADISLIHIYGAEVVPCSTYQLQVLDQSCADLEDESCYSPSLPLSTARWGDVWPPFGLVNVVDNTKLVDKFRSVAYEPGPPESGAPPKVRAMLRGDVPPFADLLNVVDVTNGIDAFRELPFDEPAPDPCP